MAVATINVQARASDGKLLQAASLPGLRLLDLVVVKGKIEKDAQGNVAIVTTGWFSRERPTLPDGLEWPN